MSDRIYYLEEPLSDEDVTFVSEAVFEGRPAVQVRIPFVLPTRPESGFSEEIAQQHAQLFRKHLRTAGIATDSGEQVAFVIPHDFHWHYVISEAVAAETGVYPWLVQTRAHREAIDNPGEIRILDMEGLLGRKG